MISHLVLFKFKRGVERDDPRVQKVIAAMNALPTSIAAIRVWEHGFNVTDVPQEGDYVDNEAWDYALRACFDDEAGLQHYFDHPAHLPIVEAWEEIADLAFCDIGSARRV